MDGLDKIEKSLLAELTTPKSELDLSIALDIKVSVIALYLEELMELGLVKKHQMYYEVVS